MMSQRTRRLLPLTAAVLTLAGCAGVTPIGELLSESSRYNGKTVRIKGEVTRSVGAVVAGAYQVRDDTGTLTVVSDRGSSPPENTRIGVKGVFQALVTLGTRSVAILREESRFDP
ncbi:MAG TPA: hypothetical protein VFZ26_06265 [Gemmatimonadales bacterium]